MYGSKSKPKHPSRSRKRHPHTFAASDGTRSCTRYGPYVCAAVAHAKRRSHAGCCPPQGKIAFDLTRVSSANTLADALCDDPAVTSYEIELEWAGQDLLKAGRTDAAAACDSLLSHVESLASFVVRGRTR